MNIGDKDNDTALHLAAMAQESGAAALLLKGITTNRNKYAQNTEVNLFAFANRLVHEDFSPLDGALFLCIQMQIS